jgi:antitoxin (DNA-binding transcriptional repressor) of toxin-antitoxin stability system
MTTVNIRAAKTHLSRLIRLIDGAAGGGEIIIAKAGRPVARLVAVEGAGKAKKRRLGSLAGVARIPADFDAPLPDETIDAFD